MVQLKLHVMEKIHPIGLMFNIISFLEQPDTYVGLSHSIFELSPEDDMRLLARSAEFADGCV
jgi:hypothetical protein